MGEKSETPVILISGPIYSQSYELGKLISETYQVPHFSLDDIIFKLLPTYNKTQLTNYTELISLVKNPEFSSVISKAFVFFNELVGQKKPIVLSGCGIEFALNIQTSVLLKITLVPSLEFRVRNSTNTFGMDELSTIDMHYKDTFAAFQPIKAEYELSIIPSVRAEETFVSLSKEQSFINAIASFKNQEDMGIIRRVKCLVCELTYEGKEEVNICPRCGNRDPDLFGDD